MNLSSFCVVSNALRLNTVRSMSLNVSKVWLVHEDGEVLVPAGEVQKGDRVVVHMGNEIPFDGNVVAGEAMVNQASLTGESVAVHRMEGATVYAGTVIEEGELTLHGKSSCECCK